MPEFNVVYVGFNTCFCPSCSNTIEGFPQKSLREFEGFQKTFFRDAGPCPICGIWCDIILTNVEQEWLKVQPKNLSHSVISHFLLGNQRTIGRLKFYEEDKVSDDLIRQLTSMMMPKFREDFTEQDWQVCVEMFLRYREEFMKKGTTKSPSSSRNKRESVKVSTVQKSNFVVRSFKFSKKS